MYVSLVFVHNQYYKSWQKLMMNSKRFVSDKIVLINNYNKCVDKYKVLVKNFHKQSIKKINFRIFHQMKVFLDKMV